VVAFEKVDFCSGVSDHFPGDAASEAPGELSEVLEDFAVVGNDSSGLPVRIISTVAVNPSVAEELDTDFPSVLCATPSVLPRPGNVFPTVGGLDVGDRVAV